MLRQVSQALLTMQRYSWEQGVAAQAFLELGETDISDHAGARRGSAARI